MARTKNRDFQQPQPPELKPERCSCWDGGKRCKKTATMHCQIDINGARIFSGDICKDHYFQRSRELWDGERAKALENPNYKPR